MLRSAVSAASSDGCRRGMRPAAWGQGTHDTVERWAQARPDDKQHKDARHSPHPPRSGNMTMSASSRASISAIGRDSCCAATSAISRACAACSKGVGNCCWYRWWRLRAPPIVTLFSSVHSVSLSRRSNVRLQGAGTVCCWLGSKARSTGACLARLHCCCLLWRNCWGCVVMWSPDLCTADDWFCCCWASFVLLLV